MKIAFDGSAFWETGMTYEEQYDTIARAGYEYINPYNEIFRDFGNDLKLQTRRYCGIKRQLKTLD